VALAYSYQAVGNGSGTDHPIPDLPFVNDAHLPLDDPDAIEAIGRGAGDGMWGRTDRCKDGGWVAFTTDPMNKELGWVVRWHPEHGRSVVLYRDEDTSSAYMTYEDEPLLFRAGGYWWDGTRWYRPSQIFDRARESYTVRPVPAALTISAADLLDNADADRGRLLQVGEVDLEQHPYAQAGRRWRDDLALWADRRGDGRHLAGCVVQLTAPELAADQLLGVTEMAETAGIGASTLRAYLARGEGEVPLPQATVGGRSMWSRPVADDWAEVRRRSSDGIAGTMAAEDHERLSVGVRELWESFTKSFVMDLWERAGIRKRFALRWRTATAVRDLAHDLAWTVAASLDRIVPMTDLGSSVRSAILWEFAEWQRLRDGETDFYAIGKQEARMLDWLIRHDPTRAAVVVAEVVGEAERKLGIPPALSDRSLRTALSLDGKLPDKGAYEQFMDNALVNDERLS
jgi:hypothetical protein